MSVRNYRDTKRKQEQAERDVQALINEFLQSRESDTDEDEDS